MVVQLTNNTVQMVSPCVYKTNEHFWKWKFWMVSNGLSVGGLSVKRQEHYFWKDIYINSNFNHGEIESLWMLVSTLWKLWICRLGLLKNNLDYGLATQKCQIRYPPNFWRTFRMPSNFCKIVLRVYNRSVISQDFFTHLPLPQIFL